MTWFGSDDKLHGHIKVRRAGVAAMGLWVLCGSYCVDHLTDGYVAPDVPELLAGRDGAKLAERLVVAGLWHVDSERGGWIFHDWSDYQVTAADVRAKREAAKERMTKARSQRVRANIPRTKTERPANDTRSSPNPVPDPDPDTLSDSPERPSGQADAAETAPHPWQVVSVIDEHSGGAVDTFVRGSIESEFGAFVRDAHTAGIRTPSWIAFAQHAKATSQPCSLRDLMGAPDNEGRRTGYFLTNRIREAERWAREQSKRVTVVTKPAVGHSTAPRASAAEIAAALAHAKGAANG